MKWQRFALGLGCAALTALAGCDLIDFQRIGRGGGHGGHGGGRGDDPCATVRCRAGTHCEEMEVQCVRAPCPPVAECVPDELSPPITSCAAVLCIVGTVCIETEEGPQCVPPDQGPCASVECEDGYACQARDGEGVCVPAGDPCGAVTCSEGQVCCNASCGICTEPDMACIQIACPPPGQTCASVLCEVGSDCVETPLGARCVPHEEENPCNLVDCPPDAPSCEVVDGEAVCVDDRPPTSCAATLCPEGTYCDDISGQAECIPAPSCDTVRCAAGTQCELVPVQCIRAPCPPLAMCVPVDEPSDPCEGRRCRPGYHCEAQDIVCITTPCDPIAQCVPDRKGVKCGDNTCDAGEVCCNPSCGICTPRGGFCTQQFCGAEI